MNAGFLVLAAGQSRRFGSTDKRLTPLDGKPLIAHVLDTLALAAPSAPVVVCVGPSTAEENFQHGLGSANACDAILASYLRTRQQHTHQQIKLFHSPRASEGMGSTLADAVNAHADWPGWIVCLADMPWILPSTYQRLLQHASPHGLLAPEWQGQRGHPVRFDRHWLSALRELRGDAGARTLLTQFHDQLTLLTVDDPGITLDIDTPSDLNRRLTRQNDASVVLL